MNKAEKDINKQRKQNVKDEYDSTMRELKKVIAESQEIPIEYIQYLSLKIRNCENYLKDIR